MTTPSQLSPEIDPENEVLVAQPDEPNVVDVDQSLEVLATTFDITSYGADYPVDGLVKRLEAGDIAVPSFDPIYEESQDIGAFQRKFVWGRPQMDRFIESLLLGLPVPGIFLIRDRTNKFMVLDGQQRLKTLQFFYSGMYSDKRYKLIHVQPPFKYLTYAELQDEDRRHLDDSIIHATILRQESESGSQDAVYSIFERLNTGGSALQPQEIRVALFPGPFLRGLSELNTNGHWRTLYGKDSPRFKDHEMILRVLSMFENSASYNRPLKGFMNKYLGKNQERALSASEPLGKLFIEAVSLLAEHVGPKAFRPLGAVNAAVIDSLCVGMMRRVAMGPISNPANFRIAYDELIKDPSYKKAIGESTSVEETVNARISAAERAFASVK